MCFSATASFVTAAATAAVGTAALWRASGPRELPLAAMPVLFAVQQTMEGLLWLDLPLAPGLSVSTGLTYVFLIVAQVVWPIYTSIALLLIEPSLARRRSLRVCLAIGIGVGAYLAWWLVAEPHGAVIRGGHIVYETDRTFSYALGFAYLAATGLPLLLSSHRAAVVLGALVVVGCATAFLFYWEAMVSVWCFFAAAVSAVILWHFEARQRQRLRLVRP